jgi:hypothetical protein
MSRNQALTSFSQDLYVSHSNIHLPQLQPEIPVPLCRETKTGTYQHRPTIRQSHARFPEELFYNSKKAGRNKEPLNALLERLRPSQSGVGKECRYASDLEKEHARPGRCYRYGPAMLTAFYESIDLSGYTVVEVEFPLSARLYTDDGQPTEFKLVGIIDLLLMDEAQRSRGGRQQNGCTAHVPGIRR